MKVYAITTDTMALAVTPIGNRLYKLARDTRVEVLTDEGSFVFKFRAGFVTNFRSGGVLVDGFVDQIGDEIKSLCYLAHDAMYTPCLVNGDAVHPVSRKMADEILRASLVFAGMSRFKAALVYRSVRLFGGPAYENDDEFTAANSRLYAMVWCA